jgi:hypothetical protein
MKVMKKSILIAVIAILGFTSAASAQEFVYFGAKGGVNFTNMSSDGFDDEKMQTGFHLGLVSEIPLNDRFSLQPEVLYATQGTEANRTFAGQNFNGEYRLDYIQVPVLAKLYLIDGLSIEAGPSFNFLVEEEYNFESDLADGEFDPEAGSAFEFGGAIGASYKFNNGFFASARYTQGFTDVFDSENWDDDAVKNNGIQVGIGLMF